MTSGTISLRQAPFPSDPDVMHVIKSRPWRQGHQEMVFGVISNFVNGNNMSGKSL